MNRTDFATLWREIQLLKRRLSGFVEGTGGAPAVHAASHEGGSDPVDVTQLDGFPGGSTTFLRADGTFATPPGTGAGLKRVVIYEIDGGGVALTGSFTRYVRVPFTGTITKWTLLADASGAIVIDVWKDTFANFPPTDADSITAGNEPELSTDNEAEDATLTGWSTTVTSGDVIGFNVDSVSGLMWVSLMLEITT